MAKRETSNLPINYHEMLAKEAADIAKKVAAPTGDRIRLNGNSSFVTPDGNEGDTMEVVIIDFVSSNMYYDSPYKAGNPQPPACYAIGPEPSLLAPSEKSPDSQADTCASCPQNQFGSAGAGKACKNTRLLAVTPYSEGLGEDAPIWIMSIPPTSLKSFDAYVHTLSSKHRTTPLGVLTEITLDKSVTYAAPRFAFARLLDNEELGIAMELREESKVRLMAEPDVSNYQPPMKGARSRAR